MKSEGCYINTPNVYLLYYSIQFYHWSLHHTEVRGQRKDGTRTVTSSYWGQRSKDGWYKKELGCILGGLIFKPNQANMWPWINVRYRLDLGCDVGDFNTKYQCGNHNISPTSQLDIESNMRLVIICNKLYLIKLIHFIHMMWQIVAQ